MRVLAAEVNKHIGKNITVAGWVHKIRKLGGISFVILRDRSGLVQIVLEKESYEKTKGISSESVVEISGKVKKEERAASGAEIIAEKVKIISEVSEDVPVEINKKDMRANIDTVLDYRPITLRHPETRNIFKVQEQIVDSFRSFLKENDFTEIKTSKIVESGLETGGAEMFEVNWFKKKAFLSQSPQMYKQMLVGVYERVFEIGFAYRAEKHSTKRHLNEYLSLDLEMGFIDSHEDIMDLEEEMLKKLCADLKNNYKEVFESFGQKIPEVKKIPRLKLEEAQKIIEKEYREKCYGEPDLSPKDEQLICEYSQKEFKSEFIFITHFPSKKRPFYTFDDPKDPGKTLSFDLLFRGLEVTTGGQRLHRYEDYIRKMDEMGIDHKKFEKYLSIFKYGMPPHGGLAIGAERLTARMLGLDNVRLASFFPRDINRLEP